MSGEGPGPVDLAALDRFARQVAERLDVELRTPASPYDGLFDDWGLDSLQAFQLLVIVEAMSDCLLPPAEIPELLTVGDAFAYYTDLRRLAADEG